jgi:hypothetical protein
MVECGGRCLIEAGVVGKLAHRECRDGRLPYDRTPARGCWRQDGAAAFVLGAARSADGSGREAA